MSRAIDGEVLTEYLGVTVQMTRAQHELIMEASLRCGSFPPDFIVKSALAAARNLVPPACQPSEASMVETPMPGLFDGEEGG